MPPGGRRAGAGRPRGSRDSPLVLARTLTSQEARTINEDAQVLAARTKLAAWDALAQRVANLNAYPAKEQTAILALALRYAGDHHATPVQSPQERAAAQTASVQVRARLNDLAVRLGVTTSTTPADDADTVDAELVWPSRAELT